MPVSAPRLADIAPFHVMELLARAKELEAEGRDIIHMEVGEPDFPTPAPILAAARNFLEDGKVFYTPALGLPELREAISGFYRQRYGIAVPASRIAITAGASGALTLALACLAAPDSEWLLTDPGYPCNRHFVTAAGGVSTLIPTTAADRFQLSAEAVRNAWGAATRGVLLASPSNPTGTSIAPNTLRDIHRVVQERGGITIVDEIYLGLSFDEQYGQSALALDDNIISINSFSKYFNMTGWRLGWMVVPEAVVGAVERLAQNLFICPSTIAQHAALACFEPESLALYEQRRHEFKARRDYFLPELRALGFDVPVMPDGAFYAWADCSQIMSNKNLSGMESVHDSWDFAFWLMEKAHIAVTPGKDFGTAQTPRFIRFSTASSMEHLQEATQRLRRLLP